MNSHTEPTLYLYAVQYTTAGDALHHVTVEALDATDAKHVAESLEGAAIVWASARRVAPVLRAPATGREQAGLDPATGPATGPAIGRDPLEDPAGVWAAQGHRPATPALVLTRSVRVHAEYAEEARRHAEAILTERGEDVTGIGNATRATGPGLTNSPLWDVAYNVRVSE